MHRNDEASTALELATEQPELRAAVFAHGFNLLWAGRAIEAEALLDRATMLSPRDSHLWSFHHGCTYWVPEPRPPRRVPRSVSKRRTDYECDRPRSGWPTVPAARPTWCGLRRSVSAIVILTHVLMPRAVRPDAPWFP